MEPSRHDSIVARRRRKITQPPREKTPDPNHLANGRRRYSEDDSSQMDITTASEDIAGAQSVRMQIRPPHTMSAHESKILRRRDKTFASSVARSHSQPRQAERLTNPEANELLRTSKRSLSSPRNEDESSESEMMNNTAEGHVSVPIRHAPNTPTQNLNKMQLNLLRFEEERKRFEAEKRNFEREKREHRLRYKQLHDNDERKLLMQSYRKLSDRIQLPSDPDERRRLVHSMRLQRNEAPQLRARKRHSGYDESSTQFSSSDADFEDTSSKQLIKQLSPVRRHVSSASAQYSASVRGTPPQPPERKSVSRNNSLSPIRPQRRSKTPEQRAQKLLKLVAEQQGEAELATIESQSTECPTSFTTHATEFMQPKPEKVGEGLRRRNNTERRDSLTETANRRKQSLERTEHEKVPAAELAVVEARAEVEHLEMKHELHHKSPPIYEFEPDELLLPQNFYAVPPGRLLSVSFVQHAFREAKHNWFHLKADYPHKVEEIRRLRNACISYTLMLIMLCGFGGLIFRYTEGTSENIYKCEVRKVKRDFIDNLWTVSHNMREDDWKTLARQKLRKFEEELHAISDLGIRYFPGQKSWNFVNCILYCWTVITTIGYGHITPKTRLGQSLTIIYAIIGIPIFLIILADFGKLFTRGMKFLWAYVRRLYYTGTCREIRKQQQVRDAMSGLNTVYDMAVRRPSHFFGMVDPESEADIESQGSKSLGASHPDTPTSPYPETFEIDDEFNLPVSVASVLLISYILIGAFVYTLWEDWTYFEAFYFVFISMSTIGFGDFVPNHPIFMMCSIIYLVFGLALTSMFINVVQIKLSDTFKQASAKIGATIGIGMSEMGDEVGSQLKTPSELASVHGSRLDKIAEDENEDGTKLKPQAPVSILKQRPLSPMQNNFNGEEVSGGYTVEQPPPLLPRKQMTMEPQPEMEKKKKKRGFFK